VLLRRSDSRSVFRWALHVQGIVGAVFLSMTVLFSLGLWQTVALLLVFLLCAGLTYPNAAALALEPFSRNIGSASSLLGFLQLGTGAVAAAIVGLLDIKGPMPLAIVLASCSAAGWAVLRSADMKRSKAVTEGA
jgi:DHA1 family bicyclomycin/chloramphenicol resistance-like MFS transporter